MSKTINIRCKQVVEYSQQRTVTDKEYKTLMAASGGNVREDHKRDGAYSIITGYLDVSEILDCEREFTDVEIEDATD